MFYCTCNHGLKDLQQHNELRSLHVICDNTVYVKLRNKVRKMYSWNSATFSWPCFSVWYKLNQVKGKPRILTSISNLTYISIRFLAFKGHCVLYFWISILFLYYHYYRLIVLFATTWWWKKITINLAHHVQDWKL